MPSKTVINPSNTSNKCHQTHQTQVFKPTEHNAIKHIIKFVNASNAMSSNTSSNPLHIKRNVIKHDCQQTHAHHVKHLKHNHQTHQTHQTQSSNTMSSNASNTMSSNIIHMWMRNKKSVLCSKKVGKMVIYFE